MTILIVGLCMSIYQQGIVVNLYYFVCVVRCLKNKIKNNLVTSFVIAKLCLYNETGEYKTKPNKN